MDKDQIFVKTLEDIEKRMQSKDSYEILMISGLLRKLLLDDNPLIHQVNQNQRLKITFTINDRQPPIDKSLTYWWIQDGLDPNTSVPHLTKPLIVSIDKLLKRQIMILKGEIITVLDLIKFLSNIQGGVHLGLPKNSKEATLKEVEGCFGIGGLQPGIRSILSISRVVVEGLRPLKTAVTK